MIFTNVKSEKVVQVGDRTRLDASQTFSPDDEAINLVEVSFDSGVTFLDITETKKIDWVFQDAGEKIVHFRVNEAETMLKNITVLSEADDRLFSSDEDINALESDLKYLYKDGRTSHLDMHREAQGKILEELYNRGITNKDSNRLTKADVIDTMELRAWSKYLTLYLIFNDVRKGAEDAYTEKAKLYRGLADRASQDKQFLKIDINGDGQADDVSLNFESISLVRR
jgi:hypothetical protein